MRKTKVASVFPVAFAGGLKYEGPKCVDGKAVDWHVTWDPRRYSLKYLFFQGVTVEYVSTHYIFSTHSLLKQFLHKVERECIERPTHCLVYNVLRLSHNHKQQFKD